MYVAVLQDQHKTPRVVDCCLAKISLLLGAKAPSDGAGAFVSTLGAAGCQYVVCHMPLSYGTQVLEGVAVTVTVFCSPCWLVKLVIVEGVAVIVLVYCWDAGISVVVYSEVMVVVVGNGYGEGVSVIVTTMVVGDSELVTSIVDSNVDIIVFVTGGKVVESITVWVAAGAVDEPPSTGTTEYVTCATRRLLRGLNAKGRASLSVVIDKRARRLEDDMSLILEENGL